MAENMFILPVLLFAEKRLQESEEVRLSSRSPRAGELMKANTKETEGWRCL